MFLVSAATEVERLLNPDLLLRSTEFENVHKNAQKMTLSWKPKKIYFYG